MYFTFIDKEKICTYKDGKIHSYESEYVKRYRETTLNHQKNREWKKNTDMMMYEEDFSSERVSVKLHSVCPTTEKNKLVYAFRVNDSAGIYYKFTDDEKKTEAHLLTSTDESFQNLFVNRNGEIFGVVQKNGYSSQIAIFSKEGGDYKSVTGGDSKDENPFYYQGNVYFNSYGIGRDANNEFLMYAPSEILRLNPQAMEIETLLSDEKFSFIKPMIDGDGNLYCIRKSVDRKEERGNGFLNILLIPVRIVEALVGFVSLFVNIFAGKPLVDGKGRTRNGNGMAKNMDERQIFVHNQLLNVEKELKNNQKDEDGGFIPHSFKLVKFPKDEANFKGERNPGMGVVIASGVADFCITEENEVIYTNGKRIFALTEDGKRKKLASTDFCLQLSTLPPTAEEEDLFSQI